MGDRGYSEDPNKRGGVGMKGSVVGTFSKKLINGGLDKRVVATFLLKPMEL